jgi:pilus assembly protein FimV
MQRRPLFSMTSRAGAFLLAALLCPSVRAVELGDITVRSYVGQQLSADIELISLAPDEVAGLPVRLALPDVFSGANIRMNPALGTVHMSVVRRDQRQFLHVTTLQAVDANYIHLFLELGAPGRQVVRAATVWLQPDPHPLPPPTPAYAAPAAAPLSARASLAPGEELDELPPPRMAPRAPAGGAARHPAASTVAPAPAVAARRRAATAAAATAAAAAADAGAGAKPMPPPIRQEAGGAACVAKSAGLSAKECVALDYRNASLSTKLVELEGKVKVLQYALESPPAAGKTPPPITPARPPAAAVAGVGAGSALATAGAGHAASAGGGHAAAPAAALVPPQAEPAPPAVPAAHADTAAHDAAAAHAAASTSAASTAASAAADAHAAPPPIVAAPAAKRLPKLKYSDKKEKPPEPAVNTGLLAAAGAAAAVLLLALGLLWYLRRRRKAAGMGSAPLKIWQGWRKKKPVEAEQPLPEVMPEELLEQEKS